MKLFRLALLNLLRHKRRTLMSTGAIVLGVFYLIVGRAFVGGIEEAIVHGAENGLAGHLQIRIADYPTVGNSLPVDELVELSPEARALLDERAEALTERTMFSATVVSRGESLRIRAVGYDPATDGAVFYRQTWKVLPPGTDAALLEGDQLAVPATAEEGILIGTFVARILEVEPGDRVVLQTRTHPGAINALEVPIAGLLMAGNTVLDQSIFVPRPLTEQLVRNPHPTHVVARLADRDTAPELAASLAPLLGEGFETRTWIDETEELIQLQSVRRRMLDVLVGVLMVMSSFAIANTILMAAYERVREIGTLRAMGMPRTGVLGLFLIEGGLMGSLAGLVGAGLGGSVAWYLAHNPVDFAEQGAMQGGNIAFTTWIYAQFSWGAVIVPVFVSLGVALLASLYPAKVASDMLIADAVRAE